MFELNLQMKIKLKRKTSLKMVNYFILFLQKLVIRFIWTNFKKQKIKNFRIVVALLCHGTANLFFVNERI